MSEQKIEKTDKSDKTATTTTTDKTAWTDGPTLKVTCLRKMGGLDMRPITNDCGLTWALPFNPSNGQAIEIFPGQAYQREVQTGLTLEIPKGYEVHIRHVLSAGRLEHYRPTLILTGGCGGREVMVNIVNTSPETIHLQPGDVCAYFTVVKQSSSVVK